MGVITRSSILREVLEEKDRQMYRYSNYGAGLTAREGYEQLFEDLKQQREMLREMIREAEQREQMSTLEGFVRMNHQALQNPEIQQRIAQWQEDIIRGKQPGVEWADQEAQANMTWNPEKQAWEPTRTPDEVLRRRRHERAEGFKPEPVTYPGGEE